MVRPFFTNIRLLILTIILILAWGVSSFQSLPRQEDPELISRVAVVKTAFPGASADRVEALVTTVLEEELSEIEEIKVLESDSRVGFSTVAVELVDQVINAQPIWAKVRDEMADAAAQFPSGAAAPELDETYVKAYTMIASLTWHLPGEPNYAILRRYSDEIGTRLRSLAGTEEVEFFGNPDEEILVEIDAPELAGVGLSPQQLAQQIGLSDAKVTAGQLRNPEQDLAIEVESELETLEQIRQLPVQSAGGQFTRLSDIASVSRGVRFPLSDQAIVGGKPAAVMGIMMQSGLRIDQWSAQVRNELDIFRDRLPQGVSLDLIFDQSTYVATRINSLIVNLIFSAVLVVLVALVGMGWRSALVVGTALPLTIFAVLGWMSVFGVAIHQMSVTGLIIALGLLIDNAVVAVDEIQVEMQHGEPPLQAVIKTVKYLQVPLLASTLTTVLTFLPIYLLPGASGEFVGSIALSVILSLISSLAISLTVISALAGRMLSASSEDYEKALHKRNKSLSDRVVLVLMKPGAWWYGGLSLSRPGRFYRWTIDRAMAKPLLTVALTMTVPLIGFIAAGTLDEQFFPLVNRDQFQIEVDFVSQTAIAQTRKTVLEAREQILKHEEVEDVHWFIGENAPKFYYNLTGNRENQSQYAQALVQLKSEQNVGGMVRELQQELDNLFPSTRTIVQQLQQGPPYDAPVEMRIYGPNISELRRIGMEVREIMTEIPDVVHIR
ncbi:MAG: efflux RND transporter permease subunit, partial [Cyanobacteria bacterium P01_H01_bin.21]